MGHIQDVMVWLIDINFLLFVTFTVNVCSNVFFACVDMLLSS